MGKPTLQGNDVKNSGQIAQWRQNKISPPRSPSLFHAHIFVDICLEPEYIFPSAQLLSVAKDDKKEGRKTKEATETQMVRQR